MKYLALVLIMALVRIPTLDTRGNGDEGVQPVEAYVDTSTGQIMNRVRQGDGENGFTYAYRPTGKTWEFANRAGSNGQMIYGSQGYTAPTFQDQGDGSFNFMGAGGDTANGMHQIGDDPKLAQWLTAHGAPPQYDPNYGYVVSSKDWSKLGPDYRNSIYTGGDFMSNLLGALGPAALMAGVGGLALSGAGLGAAGDAAATAPTATASLPDSYWSTLADAGTVSDAAPAAAGTVGNASNVAMTGADAEDLLTGAGMQGSLNNAGLSLGAGTAPNTATSTLGLGINGAAGYPSTGLSLGFQGNGVSVPTQGTTSGVTQGSTTAQGTTQTYDASGNPISASSTAQSALSRLLNGTATAADYAKLAASGVDIAAALASYNRQNQLWDSGADSRARFNQGMTNPSSVMSLFQPAVDQATDSYLRGISAKSGNPATLGSAPAETSKYVFGSTMLPLWNSYEGLNANVGWNGASTKSADAAQGLSSAVGQSAGTLTNPNSDLTTTLSNLKNLGLLPDASKAGSYISSLFGNPA